MIDSLATLSPAAPAAGAMIASLSVIIAISAFIYTRRANRRRATLDMVMKTLLDESAQARYTKFREIVRKENSPDDCFKMVSLAEPENLGSDDRTTVLHQMNIYELMALGIRRGLFDETLYKRWYHNQFMTDYEGAQNLILKLQDTKPSIYCEASSLYSKWLKRGHPVSSPSRIKMMFWAGTQNYAKLDAARAATKAR